MNIHPQTVLLKLIVWLAAEILLNCTGLDNLADYSEFLHDQEALSSNHDQPAIVVPAMKRSKTLVWGVV
jgi:hypothetical protein